MTRVEPNPRSPYATADPEFRHLFPVPFIAGKPPEPGTLAPTSCAELAVVVPLAEIMTSEPLPDGVCKLCAIAREEDTILGVSRLLAACGRCGMRTRFDGMCALCRAELHREWGSQVRAAELARRSTRAARAARSARNALHIVWPSAGPTDHIHWGQP